jgi:rod shape-determining protein MreD
VKLYILAVGGGTLIQSTIVPVLGSWTVVPDLPVVLVVLMALRRGPEVGCIIGFALGVAQDVIGGGPLGLHALSKSIVGFVAGGLPRWCLVTNPVVPVVAAVAATVVDATLRFAVLQLFQYPAPFGELLGSVILPQAAYNGVLTAIAMALPPVSARA